MNIYGTRNSALAVETAEELRNPVSERPAVSGISAVNRLLNDISDHRMAVTSQLRTAKIVASKLGQADAILWIDRELHGYGSDVADLPPYRVLNGHFQAFDPYVGWLPANFGDAAFERKCSTAHVSTALGQIEHDLTDTPRDGSFGYYLGANKAILLKIFPDATNFRVLLSAGQMYGIVDQVRNLLLKWALDLDRAGVSGIGMDFTAKERSEGQAVTQIFVQNAGVVGNVSDQATVSNVQTASIGIDHAALSAFVKLVREQGGAIPAEASRSIEPLLERIEKQLGNSTPDKSAIQQALTSIRGVCEGVVGSLVATGIAAQAAALLR